MMRARLLWFLRAVLMSAGALVLVVTFTPAVPWAGARLCTFWSDTDGDVMILLGGSTVSNPGAPSGMLLGENTYWRVVHAMYVWRSGHFRTILLCGAGSEETIKPLLIAYGVPEKEILVENRSTSTRENVLFAKPILAGLSGPFVLLTSDYHMLRASRCFARENIAVIARPCPDLMKRVGSPRLRWDCFWDLIRELGTLGYYRVRGWI
jgi:uncharacterized SAM-binding protein YcdF (DUF218 family)